MDFEAVELAVAVVVVVVQPSFSVEQPTRPKFVDDPNFEVVTIVAAVVAETFAAVEGVGELQPQPVAAVQHLVDLASAVAVDAVVEKLVPLVPPLLVPIEMLSLAMPFEFFYVACDFLAMTKFHQLNYCFVGHQFLQQSTKFASFPGAAGYSAGHLFDLASFVAEPKLPLKIKKKTAKLQFKKIQKVIFNLL